MRSTFPALLIAAFLLTGTFGNSVHAEHEGKIQILLLGDSTTEGSVPRRHVPKGPHLEDRPMVEVLDNRLDAHFAQLPGWFDDRHPNLAGYHVIGDETAKFLAPMIRKKLATPK